MADFDDNDFEYDLMRDADPEANAIWEAEMDKVFAYRDGVQLVETTDIQEVITEYLTAREW
jgi:hypothetical protein